MKAENLFENVLHDMYSMKALDFIPRILQDTHSAYSAKVHSVIKGTVARDFLPPLFSIKRTQLGP
jgi:hypothetical protein